MSETFDVTVVGGGPSGSTVAAQLAGSGRRVLLLESSHFPRYHIGESMIPAGISVMEESGVLDRVKKHGFLVKRGNTFVWGRSRGPWSIAFGEADKEAYAYQVIRSEFDSILLDYARECGAEIREHSTVREMQFDHNQRCSGVTYSDSSEISRNVSSTWVVDASGQACIIGRKLGLRRIDESLKNCAVWTYFREAGRLPEPESNYTLSAAIDEGWIWYIPLHDGTTSVGVVLGAEKLKALHREGAAKFYERHIAQSELVSRLLTNATRCQSHHLMHDWSYRCQRLVGDGWLLVGDAAGFVDPILSSGLGLALQAAHVAAKALDVSLGGGDTKLAMRAYEDFYQSYMDQFFDFVHYFYDANRHVKSYFWQARRLVEPRLNMTARNAFIYLISGRNRAAAGRSFDMGVFDNLGTPLGGKLLGHLAKALDG